MHYYELQEKAYKKMKEEGVSSWDEYIGQADSYEEFGFKVFLESTLPNLTFQSNPSSSLEIGCGTGPATCYLAGQGFDAMGIDVSSSAIEIAREQAGLRNLKNAKFEVLDLCTESLGNEKYDLIMDGHCIHCIVTIKDREFALNNIFQTLKPGGTFLLSTMLGHPKCKFSEKSIWDDEGILWTPIADSQEYQNTKKFNDKTYLAHRRVYRDSKTLEQELQSAGFTIQSSQQTEPDPADSPSCFQAVCSKP